MARKFGLKVAALVLASATALTACTSSGTPSASGSAGGDSGKTLKFAATFPVLDQYLQKVADAMQKEAAAKGVELNIQAAENKTDTQLAQVENFISQGVDGIIIVPVDTSATGPMDAAIKAAGIPSSYVNRRPSDLPEGVPYVGSDEYSAGKMQMEQLAKDLGGKGNVYILQGDPQHEGAILRTKGCQDVVAANPGMKVIDVQTGNWERDKGLSITENWLQTGKDIAAICANNDEMALGAIQALKAKNMAGGKVLVGGVDATSDGIAAVLAGDMAVTVFQNATGQGAGGVDALVDVVNGGSGESVDVPFELVLKDNAADYEGK